MISVKLTLSSISSALITFGLLSKPKENRRKFSLTVFIIVKECSEIFINCLNCLFRTKVNKTIMCFDNLF